MNELFEGFSWSERYFLLWQKIGMEFRQGHIDTASEMKSKYATYDAIYRSLLREINMEDTCKPAFHTESKLVYLFTTQFLELNHAPTAKVMQVAAFLRKKGYIPFIVNTAEMMGGHNPGVEPYIKPSYIEDYSTWDDVVYEGESYSFFQYPQGQPNSTEIVNFINLIREEPPAFAISIGDMSLLADVVNLFVPVLMIQTVNQLGLSHASMQSVGRELTEQDMDILACMGRKRESIVPGNTVYSLPKNMGSVSRATFQIPEDCFLLCVAGNRLDTELSEPFLQMLSEILCEHIRVAFIGEITTFDEISQCYPNIRDYSYRLGYQSDIAAAVTMCNLFLNPPRQGGGTISVVALNEGIPVFTLAQGDVATAVGEAFCVENLKKMKEKVIDYAGHPEKTDEVATEAKARAKYLTDETAGYGEMLAYFLRAL